MIEILDHTLNALPGEPPLDWLFNINFQNCILFFPVTNGGSYLDLRIT
jgi:hypothetical protein